VSRRLLATVEISAATLPPAFRTGIALWVDPMVALAPGLAATVMETDRRARSFRSRLISELTRSRRVGSPISARSLAVSDPPPLKWSDLRYVFDIKEDCNGKEAIQA
jgi:hypothetical protein